MQLYLRSAVIIIGLLLLQTTFIPFISLGGYLPDLLLLYIVYHALRYGQVQATIAGFLVGLFQDILTIKLMGLAALAKTLTGFTAGYFFNENTTGQTLGSYRYILLIGLCSLVHNGIYYTIFFQGSGQPVFWPTVEMTFGMTLYTCVIGILPMFSFSRTYDVSWTQ